MRPLLRRILALSLLFAAPVALRAQTGSIDPTPEELATLSMLGGAEIELIEEPVVDLRRWLPSVGEQGMNDCTAWAIGYAAKSFLEARDQGWRPDEPSRIFSPLFLYNQLNGGKDEGSNFYRMVKFMAEHGCATLATSPYVAGNFTAQPSDRARAEAQVFPVLDLVLLTSRNAIRRALQRRQVVVFGAHVNPMFLAGTFDTYTAELFVRDGKLRQPNQPHGKHAMVIAGYDDGRGAFLIQNSWGAEWCQRGYAWVAYELFDRIEIAADDAVFCNWACTIEDLEQDVEVLPDGAVRAKAEEQRALRAHGYSDISHYDRALGKYVYTFSAELRGPREALSAVTSVTWTWIDEQGAEQSSESLFALTRYAVLGSTVRNPLQLRAKVELADGNTLDLRSEITGPNPKADFRDAKIAFEDDYYGPSDDGTPLFWWEAFLDYPLEQRDDIVKVVWSLGEMNRREPVQTMTGFNGKVADERAIGMCATTSPISAEIHYVDGGIKSVSVAPQIRDQVREGFAIELEAKRMGTSENGRSLHSWVLKVDRPRRQQFEIEKVTWTLDPLFSIPVLDAVDSFASFPIFGMADRDFRAIATLHLKGGGTQVLEEWVTLAPDTAYPDEDRVALESWNRYTGRESGEPQFTGHMRLTGDRRSLERLDKVFFQEEGVEDTQEYQVHGGGDHPQWSWGLNGGESAVLNARLVFKDGREKKLRLEHRRTLVPDDNVGFRVSMQEKPTTYLDFHHQETHQYTILPIGPDQDLARVVGVEWLHRTIGPRERSIQPTRRTGFFEGLAFTSVLTKPFELEARLHYHTGFHETLRLPMTRITSGDLVPDLALRVREKFWGYEDGLPYWQVWLEIARDEKVWTAPVAKAIYTLQSIDRDAPYQPFVSTDPRGLYSLRTDRPCTVRAELEFADGRSAELEGYVPAMSERTAEEVVIRRYHDNYALKFNNRWLLVVEAWESVHQNLQSVTWDAEYDLFDRTDDFASGVPGVIVCTRSSQEGGETLRITVKKGDGTEVAFQEHVGDALEPVNWSYGTRYYGDGLWQLDAEAIGDWSNLKDLGKSFRLESPAGLSIDEVGAWPMGRKRALAKAGTYTIPGGTYRGEQKLSGLELRLGAGENAPSETLALSVCRSPFRHALATVPEWILAITGPEKQMQRIAKVVYEYEDRQPRVARVTQRWGELYEGFEHRAHGETAPAVKATVHFEDGTSTTLEH